MVLLMDLVQPDGDPTIRCRRCFYRQLSVLKGVVDILFVIHLIPHGEGTGTAVTPPPMAASTELYPSSADGGRGGHAVANDAPPRHGRPHRLPTMDASVAMYSARVRRCRRLGN